MSQPEDKKPPPSEPGELLWDRIAEDIIERGAPCYDTVAELVDSACRQQPPPAPAPRKE